MTEDVGQAQLQEKADKITELGYHPSDGADMDVIDDTIAAHEETVKEHLMPPEGNAAESLETTDAGSSEDEGASEDGPSKEELYERAQELDIPGRSTMSKEELASAIAEAEGQ